MQCYNSEQITWSNTFSCGVKIIDDQHKELVDMVNEMLEHVTGSEKEEYDYFSKVINKIVNYFKLHFATEEKIMLAAQYPGYDEHKKVHEGFNHAVAEAFNGFVSGKRLSLFTFTRFLKNWVFSHIAVMDKHYFDYLRKIATRKDDGKLSITVADVQTAAGNRKLNTLHKKKAS